MKILDNSQRILRFTHDLRVLGILRLRSFPLQSPRRIDYLFLHVRQLPRFAALATLRLLLA